MFSTALRRSSQSADPIREKLTELRGELKPEPKIRALTDMGGVPSTAYLLQRGNAMNPGRPVEPNTPVVASAHIKPYTPVNRRRRSTRAATAWVWPAG